MKRKKMYLLLGIMMTSAMLCIGNTYAAEQSKLDPQEMSTKITENEETEIIAEANPVVEETEKMAGLFDYGYEKGVLEKDNWSSKFLKMSYIPEKGIAISASDNEALEKYHDKDGEGKQVAHNEFIARDSDKGYVQMMVEVNPNLECSEEILPRFVKNEDLELVSETKELEIAEKKFLTCTGVKNKERYLVGICTDEPYYVIALKIKYEESDNMDLFIKGFSAIKEEQVEEITVVKTETEAAAEILKETDSHREISISDNEAESEIETENKLKSLEERVKAKKEELERK